MSPQDIWQAESSDAPRISLAYLRLRAEEVQRKTGGRTGLNAVMGLLISVYLVYVGFTRCTGKPFTQGFFVFTFLGAIYGAVCWLRQGKPKPLIPADAGALDSLRFFRREVEQRISNLSRFGLLGALVGPVVGVIVGLLSLEHGWTSHGIWVYLAVKFGILFPAVILYLIHRRKRFLRQELAALDALRS